MAQPTSYRLPEELLRRIDEEAAGRGTSVTALVAALLDEGLKTRRFPGIVYRDGPAGRRAGVVEGPDVWEIIGALKHTRGQGEQRIVQLAEEIAVPPSVIRLAVDFYSAFPEDVDHRIALDQQAFDRMRELVHRRDELLSE
jgi:hypothetical protein